VTRRVARTVNYAVAICGSSACVGRSYDRGDELPSASSDRGTTSAARHDGATGFRLVAKFGSKAASSLFRLELPLRVGIC
jgi:hypothetical protein